MEDNSQRINELERLVGRLSNDLAENFFQTLQILSSIVGFTERFYDGSHAKYVSEKSAELARILGLGKEDVFQIKVAGLLHDIGKVGFYDSALYKYPNEMRPNEFKQYSLHPEIGRQILSNHHGFDNIAEIIFQHHERIDGSGFPLGLKGNQVHPGAAIIGVVDYYHNAVYKIKRDREDIQDSKVINTQAFLNTTKEKYSSAMSFLQQKKGILYDRKVVDAFMAIAEMDRSKVNGKIVQRISVNLIRPGMMFVENYYTSFGLLIASKGETVNKEMLSALIRFAENGEIPHKILVLADAID